MISAVSPCPLEYQQMLSNRDFHVVWNLLGGRCRLRIVFKAEGMNVEHEYHSNNNNKKKNNNDNNKCPDQCPKSPARHRNVWQQNKSHLPTVLWQVLTRN